MALRFQIIGSFGLSAIGGKPLKPYCLIFLDSKLWQKTGLSQPTVTNGDGNGVEEKIMDFIWNYTCYLYDAELKNVKKSITVEIWDWNLVDNRDFIGLVHFDLATVNKAQLSTITSTVQLRTKDDTSNASGLLNIQLDKVLHPSAKIPEEDIVSKASIGPVLATLSAPETTDINSLATNISQIIQALKSPKLLLLLRINALMYFLI